MTEDTRGEKGGGHIRVGNHRGGDKRGKDRQYIRRHRGDMKEEGIKEET